MGRMTEVKLPTMGKHASGQAFVRLNGRCVYLGKHGTPEARAAYDRVVGEWLANGRRPPGDGPSAASGGVSMAILLVRYLEFAEGYYRRGDQPTGEIVSITRALAPVARLYRATPAAQFSPVALKAVRDVWIEEGRTRASINRDVHRVRAVFRWGVAQGLVPADVLAALKTLEPLKRGRTTARESEPVKPVDDAFVDAVKPFVSRQVWAMVELQRHSGMRPGEAIIMRACDLDMRGAVWQYRPSSHKNEFRGHERIIDLGPKCQETIRPFLTTDTERYLFSPADAVREHHEARGAARQTHPSTGNRAGTNRKARPRKQAGERYTVASYRRAIATACDRADEAAHEAARKAGKAVDANVRIVPQWHPHQLRHTFATMIRREYNVETARLMLGHSSLAATQIYAEADRAKARTVAGKIG